MFHITKAKNPSKERNTTQMVAFSKPMPNTDITPADNYYFYGSCWHNALYNLTHSTEHEPKVNEPPHRIVAGSMTTADKRPIPIWGKDGLADPANYLKDWASSHVWIEDADGRIWDYLPDSYNESIVFIAEKYRLPRSKTVKPIPAGGIDINGMTNAEIERTYGFRFHPAPQYAQNYILGNAYSKWIPIAPFSFWLDGEILEGWLHLGTQIPHEPNSKDIREMILRNAMLKEELNFNGAIGLGGHSDAKALAYLRYYFSTIALDIPSLTIDMDGIGWRTLTIPGDDEHNEMVKDFMRTGQPPASLLTKIQYWMDNMRGNETDVTEMIAQRLGNIGIDRSMLSESLRLLTAEGFTVDQIIVDKLMAGAPEKITDMD